MQVDCSAQQRQHLQQGEVCLVQHQLLLRQEEGSLGVEELLLHLLLADCLVVHRRSQQVEVYSVPRQRQQLRQRVGSHLRLLRTKLEWANMGNSIIFSYGN